MASFGSCVCLIQMLGMFFVLYVDSHTAPSSDCDHSLVQPSPPCNRRLLNCRRPKSPRTYVRMAYAMAGNGEYREQKKVVVLRSYVKQSGQRSMKLISKGKWDVLLLTLLPSKSDVLSHSTDPPPGDGFLHELRCRGWDLRTQPRCKLGPTRLSRWSLQESQLSSLCAFTLVSILVPAAPSYLMSDTRSGRRKGGRRFGRKASTQDCLLLAS
ncbi:uncharacterized protein B0T15DRAFT_273208 [Chaetomium strumarium]|uniref:Secreted protein n=1 Tax=Chaetomium strumarium TaxID=1170767 RepID=A0AAJ0GNT6_9PEZI|nr:hypothetical protein B0T15DRAFT_273208 [Chaetomium strumarium]